MRDKVSVTIGIPAFNEGHNIENLLRQIISQNKAGFYVDKIIVASDGSTDDTAEIARKFERQGVIVIDGKKNYGQNYRQNEIIKNTNSDILVLLNADLLLGNNDVISHLLSPILEGADLAAQWAIPLKPQTFIERILCAGFRLKYFVYTRYKGGDNIYTSVGHMRSFSKRFYSKVEFPSVSDGEDQFLYLTCVSRGFIYKYVWHAVAYFRLPSTFSDYKKYARRIFQTQKKHIDIFGENVAHKERALPLRLQLHGCIHAIKDEKLYAFLYILLHVIIQQWSLRQSSNTNSAFEVSTSSKRLT